MRRSLFETLLKELLHLFVREGVPLLFRIKRFDHGQTTESGGSRLPVEITPQCRSSCFGD
ncbi:hypothetical protein Hjap01_03780 [Haloarcula japonica]|uniref:Uncharacterized protein n=1 Tax=Haloarcula sebkhae TaxID=932660 RepID=A0A830EVV8_9EURY|nr:hypothetical protein GCM10009067_35320 [Haloarcula sebkhae]